VPTAILFVLASVLVAFVTERTVWLLAESECPLHEHPDRKQLPWQVAPWRSRLRISLALLAIPLVAGAAFRFDDVEAVIVSVLLLALLICAATDLLSYRVPNAVTYPGIGLALLGALLAPQGDFSGAAIAAGLSVAVFLAISALTGGGIGVADAKLAVLIGAALGLPGAFHALALGVIAGGIVMGTLLLAGAVSRKQVTPYAPFLALSAIVIVFLQGTAFAPA
jgi:leader peptidase (prepilin peptidase)/N-methyltransferase